MWNQAFKWVSQYYDTDEKKDKIIKPMSKEDFEFLEKAFESITINETKEIIKRIDKLYEKDEIKDDIEDIKEREFLIDEIIDFIDGLEVARNLVRCDRYKDIIKIFFESVHFPLKIKSAKLLSISLQNDKLVQEYSVKHGLFECLNYLNIEKLDNLNISNVQKRELINKTILLISGLINGDSTISKNEFVIQRGFEILLSLSDCYHSLRFFRIFEELTKPEIDKELKDSSDFIIKDFLKHKGIERITKILLNMNEGDNIIDINDKDEIKIIILNIISNTSHLWNEDVYTYFKNFVDSLYKIIIIDDDRKLIEKYCKNIDIIYKSKKQFVNDIDNLSYCTMEDGGKVLQLK